MIPSLIFLLLRRYQKKHPQGAKLLFSRLRFALRVALLLLLTLGLSILAASQDRVLHYAVVRSGNLIGNLTVKESIAGKRAVYQLKSEVKENFIFTVTGKAVEEAFMKTGY
jgi:hypothetical protein